MSTFTDRDLYEMLQEYLTPIAWVNWERLAPEMQYSVEGLANAIYKRLRGAERPDVYDGRPYVTDEAALLHEIRDLMLARVREAGQ